MREERGGGGRGRDKDKKDGKGGEAPRRGFFRRRRVCKFCAEKIDYINYKDVRLLAPFLSAGRSSRGASRARARCTSASCRPRSSARGSSRSSRT